MNTWVDQLLVELREKASVLRQQLEGIEGAIMSLEHGYDQKPMDYPKAAMRRLGEATSELGKLAQGDT
jgi:hypothetical protein